MKDFKKLFDELETMSSSANVSCSEFITLLEDLGFEITNCGSAGHKIAKHSAVDVISYPNFNCGHNKGSKILKVYIKKIFKFVKENEETIKARFQ